MDIIILYNLVLPLIPSFPSEKGIVSLVGILVMILYGLKVL